MNKVWIKSAYHDNTEENTHVEDTCDGKIFYNQIAKGGGAVVSGTLFSGKTTD